MLIAKFNVEVKDRFNTRENEVRERIFYNGFFDIDFDR